MKTTTCLTMTALSALLLVAGNIATPAEAAVKIKVNAPQVKPNVRIRVRPRIRINTNTKRLVTRGTNPAKLPANTINQAGPQPEPPTTPSHTNATNIDPTVLPREKPVRTAALPGGDIPSPVTDDAVAPDTPTLNVRDGLRELFEVTGGNLNDLRDAADIDALRGLRAVQDFFTAGFGDNTLPDGTALGSQRHDANFDGPSTAPGEVRGNQSHVMSGWTLSGTSQVGDTVAARWTRETKYGTETYTQEYHSSGATETTITTRGPNKTSSTETITISDADDDDLRDITRTTSNSDGTTSQEDGITGSATAPNHVDQNGDGRPDNSNTPPAEAETAEGLTPPPPEDAGGGDQGVDNIDPRYSNPGGSIWTPLVGTIISSVTPFDKISQPDADVQGTVTVSGAARPNVGPAAVTNPGDGSFVAGSNDGSGGFKMNPCANVAGGDCGGTNPGVPGPTGS